MKKNRKKKSPEPTTSLKRKQFVRNVLIGAVIILGIMLVGVMFRPGSDPLASSADAAQSRLALEDIPFNGTRSYEYLKQVCDIGRRPSGSEGMKTQQELLQTHFATLGDVVHRQNFQIRHPVEGTPVPMTNLIVQWAPERPRRILLCCHYDTLPYPMLDRRNPHGEFIGANDGGSGVALLMELGHEMREIVEKHQTEFGVDFVFLDGEEFIFVPRGGRYFWGSEYFARQYVAGKLPYQAQYRWGILLDMIGDTDLRIPQEQHGLTWRDTRLLVRDVWATARRLGVVEFVPQRGIAIQDDHLMLHDVGKIPTIDLIDFDYPPWHTMGDTPDKCSALSLAKVGWVVREWLKATD